MEALLCGLQLHHFGVHNRLQKAPADFCCDFVLCDVSSTNRSKHTAAPDYYRTPVPAILDFFDAIQEDWREVLNTDAFSFVASLNVLDPCAGGASEHDMSYPVAIRQHPFGNTLENWSQSMYGRIPVPN